MGHTWGEDTRKGVITAHPHVRRVLGPPELSTAPPDTVLTHSNMPKRKLQIQGKDKKVGAKYHRTQLRGSSMRPIDTPIDICGESPWCFQFTTCSRCCITESS